jgi:hypothetical protein
LPEGAGRDKAGVDPIETVDRRSWFEGDIVAQVGLAVHIGDPKPVLGGSFHIDRGQGIEAIPGLGEGVNRIVASFNLEEGTGHGGNGRVAGQRDGPGEPE